VKGIQKTLDKSCGGQSLVGLFPPCLSNSPSSVAYCIDREIACRVCQSINRTTGTNRDCELFDDGLANQSCACGNGVINSGEDCDDGNNSSGDGCTNTCKIEIG
jgi:cysteine-rich repeat protein